MVESKSFLKLFFVPISSLGNLQNGQISAHTELLRAKKPPAAAVLGRFQRAKGGQCDQFGAAIHSNHEYRRQKTHIAILGPKVCTHQIKQTKNSPSITQATSFWTS